jgi:hypothetical protein
LRHGQRSAKTPTNQVLQRSGRVHDSRGLSDYGPLAGSKRQRASQVIREQRGQTGQPFMTGRTDGNRAASEQAVADLRQPCPRVVVPAHWQRAVSQVNCSLGGAGQDSGATQCRGECLDIVGGQLYVGVYVDARIPLREFITRVERCTLRCHRQLEDAYRRAKGGRHGGGVVAAAVSDHNYVEVSSSVRRYKLPEQASDDASLVVRRHDHADHGHGMPRRSGLMRSLPTLAAGHANSAQSRSGVVAFRAI